MTSRFRRWTIGAVVAVPILAIVVGVSYFKYRQYQFVRSLDLVVFSTSMIGGPDPAKVKAAQNRADELGVDLFTAYRNHLKDGRRFSLACLLIDRQSADYFEFCREHIADVPWPEVRVWRVVVHDDASKAETRDKILQLLLSSPTSEAKLFAGNWYRDRNRRPESEDAYYAAMTSVEFWDALDAADQLLESERYRTDAIKHHLTVLVDGEHLTWRAAASLVNAYKLEELKPLLEAAKGERGYGPQGRELVKRLQQHATEDVGQLDSPFTVCSCNVVGAFRAWLAPHLLVAIAPLGVWLLRRSGWQISLRTMLVVTTLIALVAWLMADRIRLIGSSPAPFAYALDFFNSLSATVAVTFLFSLALTALLAKLVRSAGRA